MSDIPLWAEFFTASPIDSYCSEIKSTLHNHLSVNTFISNTNIRNKTHWACTNLAVIADWLTLSIIFCRYSTHRPLALLYTSAGPCRINCRTYAAPWMELLVITDYGNRNSHYGSLSDHKLTTRLSVLWKKSISLSCRSLTDLKKAWKKGEFSCDLFSLSI